MSLTVRDATEADREPIAACHRRAIEAIDSGAYDASQRRAWADAVDAEEYDLSDADRPFVVAIRDDTVVGFATASTEPGDHLRVDVDAELDACYVAPAAQGAGVGRQCFDAVATELGAAGATTLACWASLNARPFYRALGFEAIAERTHEFEDGTALPVVEMYTALPV